MGESEQVKRQLKGVPLGLDMKFCQMKSRSGRNFRRIMDFGCLFVCVTVVKNCKVRQSIVRVDCI